MAKNATVATGAKKKVAVTLPKLKLFFQFRPGKHGGDADRAVAGLEFSVVVGGAEVQKGKTAADGSIELEIPPGKAVQLNVLGSTYEVKNVKALEGGSSVKGKQRRLAALGYELGTVDGAFGEKSDRSTLNFQADQGLEPDGIAGKNTQGKLKSEFGA
jgi:murein L,D-transpeptidase YcbB/YkuD